MFVVAMPKFKIMQKLVDKLNLVTREILTGLQVIRAFHLQRRKSRLASGCRRRLISKQSNGMMPVMMVIMNAISVLMV